MALQHHKHPNHFRSHLIILESLPKLLFFNPSTSLGKWVCGNVVLYTVIGALLAGIFEETGRLVAFKTVLRKCTNKETGISHGIGHGGFEAMFLMAVSGIQYMAYASMINAGTFQAVIDQAAATGADISSLEALPAQIMAITPMSAALGIVERVFAMIRLEELEAAKREVEKVSGERPVTQKLFKAI